MRSAATLHSPEAERAVLAAVLLKPELLEDLPLSPADFYLERHQALFGTFQELLAEHRPIDLRTVQASLELHGQLGHVGGLAYLAELDLDLPDIGRIDTYAEIVRERAVRRRLEQAGRRMQEQAGNGELTAGGIA
ncbi:MAG: hypothetical protein M3O15_16400, partial [Acidobacteriota bacterium]|nr:hypothetical protein [Acidobacteriota bacterium]